MQYALRNLPSGARAGMGIISTATYLEMIVKDQIVPSELGRIILSTKRSDDFSRKSQIYAFRLQNQLTYTAS